MVILRWVLIVLGGLIAVGGVVFTGGLLRLSRTQPTTEEVELGVTDGALTPCPQSPNCVSTQADPADDVHYAEPIAYDGAPDKVAENLTRWIEAEDGAELVRSDGRYLRAVFSSRVFGFKDDVEILIEEEVIHLRSASRVGYSDMGVNRDRYRRIRQAIQGTAEGRDGATE